MKRCLIAAVWLLGVSSVVWGEKHTFTYKPAPGVEVKSVNAAGSFNNWSTTATPLEKRADGTFAATVDIDEGVYQYKFIVNGKDWTPDPNGDRELAEPDGYGGMNSAVLVGKDARKAPPAKPDAVNGEFVLFDPGSSSDVNVATDDLARIRIRTQAKDVDSVWIHYGSGDPSAAWKTQRLYKTGTQLGLDTYSCFLAPGVGSVRYVFKFEDGKAELTYSPAGVEGKPGRESFKLEMKPAFQTPDWAKEAVWYQIFPERFRNGDRSNDPAGAQRWQSRWFSTLPGEAPGEGNFYKGKGNVWLRRYGGDVQGLVQALPYLKELGVTAIYLNPMFEAESLHKYDTTDYRHIDDNFGVKGDLAEVSSETEDPATWKWTKSDRLFLDFVDKAHRMGFKVVLDGVFNHVGREHWAFQDVLKNGKKSKYAEWFDVRDWGDGTPGSIKYIAWDKGGEPTNDGALPVFRKDPKLGLVHGPREHVLAVTKRWLAPDGDASKGIDGWRLDVANDIPHPFWVEFRKVVKESKPDGYIAGEIWSFAQPWLRGDQFDAVMNYQFAMPTQEFFVNVKNAISPSQYNNKLANVINAYPLQVSLAQMNLLDSHDTDRFASMFVNPDLVYDASNRLQDNGPRYSADKPTAEQWARMRQALVVQFTFLGAPMIYYGDEVGMWSPDDPSNRQPMVWKDLQPYDDPAVKFDQAMFEHYRKLIAIRHLYPALRLGFYRPVLMDDARSIFVYARDLGEETVYVAVNRSRKAQSVTFEVSGKERLVDRFGERKVRVSGGKAEVDLPAWGSAVLAREK